MLGQTLFPYKGTLDLMPSCPVHPYPTLWFTRIPSCSRSDAVLSRLSIPPPLVLVSLSLSLPLSFSVSVFRFLSLALWWVSRSLTNCIHYIAFYFCFFMDFLNDLGSVSCARPDSFVMHSASSGTPGSHTSAGNFSVIRHTVAHVHTTVSLTPTLSSGSK